MRSNLHRMRFSSTACLPQRCNLVSSNIDTGRDVPRPEHYLSLFFQGFCSLTEIRQPPCSQLEHSKQGFLNCLNCAVGGKIQELFYHFIPTYTLLLGRAQITALILSSSRIHTPSQWPQRTFVPLLLKTKIFIILPTSSNCLLHRENKKIEVTGKEKLPALIMNLQSWTISEHTGGGQFCSAFPVGCLFMNMFTLSHDTRKLHSSQCFSVKKS